jgi:hypothetical protein
MMKNGKEIQKHFEALRYELFLKSRTKIPDVGNWGII